MLFRELYKLYRLVPLCGGSYPSLDRYIEASYLGSKIIVMESFWFS